MSVAGNISFENFCAVCNKIISAVTKDKKSSILSNFISSWKDLSKSLKSSNPDLNDSFFPVLRFLLPQLDRERGAYGVKEYTLAKIYIRILCLPKDSTDAVKLLNYRAPKSAGNQAGDFAEVAYWILKNRCSTGGELSIEDVNSFLDRIAEKHAGHDPRGVDNELFKLLTTTSAEEQKWLIRILLKDVKLGIGHKKILTTFHPDAEVLYDVSNNLMKVCQKLKDVNVRLHEVDVELFSPFRPMLSEECDVKKVDSYLKKSAYFFIETKFDGERFQVHMQDGRFQYFSRNGIDYTNTYGANDQEGVLTPTLSKRISRDTQSVILDGEMMVWNDKTASFTNKGMNVDVKFLKENSSLKPCYCIFDILYHNGEVLSDKPLVYRREKLKNVIEPLETMVLVSEVTKVCTKQQVWECLNDAIDNRLEGVVMKDFMSVYKPNVRKNGGWYKIKPEYTDGLMDELDVLILGGYRGGGRHHSGYSHFMIGVAVPPVPPHTTPHVFHSMGRVGSGYNMGELSELQNKLEPHWNVTDRNVMPANIVWSREKPDVWIEPCNSFILQVKAAEIIPGDSYKTNYTLRFPRVVKIRYDKNWSDCLTTVEFEEKLNMASGKLFTKHVEESADVEMAPEVKKKKSSKRLTELGSQFRGADLSNIRTEYNLLQDKEICVIDGFERVSKHDLEVLIVKYGGTVVQNPSANTFCVSAQEPTLRVRNIIRSGQHDVVKSSVLVGVLTPDTRALPLWRPRDLLGASRDTKTRLDREYDEYGDSASEATDEATLRELVAGLKEKVNHKILSKEELLDFDCELFSDVNPYSFFRITNCYFYNRTSDYTEAVLCLEYEFYGGNVMSGLNNEVTHVVVSDRDQSGVEDLKMKRREMVKKFHIVSSLWIRNCLNSRRLLPEIDYEL